jgi:hypothetical protein
MIEMGIRDRKAKWPTKEYICRFRDNRGSRMTQTKSERVKKPSKDARLIDATRLMKRINRRAVFPAFHFSKKTLRAK